MTKDAFLDCFRNNEKEYGKYGAILVDPELTEIAANSSPKVLYRHLEQLYQLNEEEKQLIRSKVRSFRAFLLRWKKGSGSTTAKKSVKKKADKTSSFQFSKEVFKNEGTGIKLM
jgi:hypothetical protein